MNKQDAIRNLLNDDPDARNQGHREIARRLDCDEGMVRRVRKVWEAERAAHNLARTDDRDEADTILANLIASGRVEEEILEAMQEIKDEQTDLKKRLTRARLQRAIAFAAAEESFPLWENHVRRAEVVEEEEAPQGVAKPQLAGVG